MLLVSDNCSLAILAEPKLGADCCKPVVSPSPPIGGKISVDILSSSGGSPIFWDNYWFCIFDFIFGVTEELGTPPSEAGDIKGLTAAPVSNWVPVP